MITGHDLDNSKPVLIWALCFTAGSIADNLHIIAGVVSISYTAFKFYQDYKKSRKK